LWKRMHEQGLLLREPGRRKNLVRKTVADKRRYVVDIAAGLLSSEIGPIDPIGPIEHQPLQNQGGLVDLFPAWYQKSRPTSMEKKRPTAEDTSSSSSWASFAASPGPTFLPEEAHENGLQPQQNQERGPIGPIGPTIHTIVALRATPHADVDLSLTGAPPLQGCPQCGGSDWLPLVTSRQCRRCGYRDGPTAQEILAPE
jgi:hypothetical protein